MIDGGALTAVLDDALVLAGIVWMVARQFRWRSADPRRILRLPAAIAMIGGATLVTQLATGERWDAADGLLLGELTLVAAIGVVLGRVTRFRRVDGGLQYRLSRTGLAWWAVFLGVRVGSFLLATAAGARLAESSGFLLLSFGVTRLAAALVVRRRVLSGAPAVSGQSGRTA